MVTEKATDHKNHLAWSWQTRLNSCSSEHGANGTTLNGCPTTQAEKRDDRNLCRGRPSI